MRTATVGLLLSVLVLGCADKGGPNQAPWSREAKKDAPKKDGPAGRQPAPAAPPAAAALELRQEGVALNAPAAEVAAGERKDDAGKVPEEAQRKIIYTAHLDLAVEDLDTAQVAVEKELEEVKGYIARSEMRGQPGMPREGQWTLRVPAVQFGPLRRAILKLGIIRRNSVDSEDVTERFFDTEARLKNNQSEEQALRKLQEKTESGKMEDLLAIRRELASVRGTIETQQGQLNRWDKLSRLATIELTLIEDRNYTPSETGFGVSVRGAFRGSIDALVSVGKGVVLVLAALVPWLPLLALFAVVIWRLLRRGPVPTASPETGAQP